MKSTNDAKSNDSKESPLIQVQTNESFTTSKVKEQKGIILPSLLVDVFPNKFDIEEDKIGEFFNYFGFRNKGE